MTKTCWHIFAFFTLFLVCGCSADNQASQVNSDNFVTEFHPPVDGKLSEQQLKNYIQIKKSISRQLAGQNAAMRQNPQSSQSVPASENKPLYYDRLEKAAANSVDMSIEEYNWIKDTVINTQSTILVRQYFQLNKKIVRLLDDTLTHYKTHQMPQQANTEQDSMNIYVDEMKQEISSLDEKVADMDSLSESERHNIELVTRYQSQLASLVPVANPSRKP